MIPIRVYVAAKKFAYSVLSDAKSYLIVTHVDADGAASGAMFVRIFNSVGYKNELVFVERVEISIPEIVDKSKDYDAIMFCDLGDAVKVANDVLKRTNKRIFIVDHHEVAPPLALDPSIAFFNIVALGLSGGKDASASTTVFLLSKYLVGWNDPVLAKLAMVGAAGDLQPLRELNELPIKILKRFNVGEVIVCPDSFGLSQTIRALLSNQLRNQGRSYAVYLIDMILQDAGADKSARWSTIDERTRRILRSKLKITAGIDFCDKVIFTDEDPRSHFSNPDEFSMVLNDCVRTGLKKGGEKIALDICLGDRSESLLSRVDYFRKERAATLGEILTAIKSGTIPISQEFNYTQFLNLGCFDKKTEILTESGFKLFKNITHNDKIATLNPKNGYIEYQKPIVIQRFHYVGPMIHFKGKSHDLLVTPDHNMYCSIRRDISKEKARQFSIVPAHKVANGYNGYYQFKHDGKWRGKTISFFNLPTVEAKSSFLENIHQQIEKISIKPWLKFLGWYLTKGYCVEGKKPRMYRVSIRQNGRGRYELVNLIKELGFKPHIDNGHVHLYSKQLWMYLRQFGRPYDRFIPKEVKRLCPSLLKLLFGTLLAGDGSCGENGTIFTSSSKKLIDDFQEICLKIGYSCSVNERHNVVPADCKIVGLRRHGRGMYYASVSTKRLNPQQTAFSKPAFVIYKGPVYDVTVPNHVIFVRRNGKVMWSGNSKYAGRPPFKLTSTIATMLAMGDFPLVSPHKYLIVFSTLNDELSRASIRAPERIRKRILGRPAVFPPVNEIIAKLTPDPILTGGGHTVSGGIIVPIEKVLDTVAAFDKVVGDYFGRELSLEATAFAAIKLARRQIDKSVVSEMYVKKTGYYSPGEKLHLGVVISPIGEKVDIEKELLPLIGNVYVYLKQTRKRALRYVFQAKNKFVDEKNIYFYTDEIEFPTNIDGPIKVIPMIEITSPRVYDVFTVDYDIFVFDYDRFVWTLERGGILYKAIYNYLYKRRSEPKDYLVSYYYYLSPSKLSSTSPAERTKKVGKSTDVPQDCIPAHELRAALPAEIEALAKESGISEKEKKNVLDRLERRDFERLIRETCYLNLTSTPYYGTVSDKGRVYDEYLVRACGKHAPPPPKKEEAKPSPT